MDLKEEIEKVAYELFERDGREHGKDREHWLEAEKIVKARRTQGQKGAGSPKVEKAPVPAKAAAPKTPAVKPASGAAGRQAAKPAASKAPTKERKARQKSKNGH